MATGLLERWDMTTHQQTALAAAALVMGGGLLSRGLRATRRIDFRGRSVVITGGSRGLGLLMARELAAQGARLTLGARDEAELGRARADLIAIGADVAIVTCNVAERGQAEALVNAAIERTGRIDVLINNAGIITVGPLEHMGVHDFEEAMRVHFWGPLYTMLAALPLMRRQRFGRIVNVSSIGGRIGVPHLVPYCASKFALTGLSEAARAELTRDGINVTTVCPGLMRTGSPFNAWFKGRYREEFRWFAIADSLPLASVDARRAARQIVEACRHGDADLTISLPARLSVLANAVLPEAVATVMSLANHFILPDARDGTGREAHRGWQSLSSWAPSTLTRLTDRAAAANNELPPSARDLASS